MASLTFIRAKTPSASTIVVSWLFIILYSGITFVLTGVITPFDAEPVGKGLVLFVGVATVSYLSLLRQPDSC